ncbi:hypothetical protein NW764_008949 [Fusarium oxysporum]|nr:hypothetical protein NW764_008949 [Fusarium oxysporum]
MSSKDVSAYKEYALGITMIPYDQNSFNPNHGYSTTAHHTHALFRVNSLKSRHLVLSHDDT